MKKYVVFIMLLLLCGCNDATKLYKEELKYKDKITINVGEEVPRAKDYIEGDFDPNASINWDNIVLEDNKVYYCGTYNGKINLENVIDVSLEVIDTEAPTIEVEDITITIGDKMDLLSKVKVTDNSKDDLDIKLDNYDLNKVGTYNVVVTATDKCNNISTKTFNR